MDLLQHDSLLRHLKTTYKPSKKHKIMPIQTHARFDFNAYELMFKD